VVGRQLTSCLFRRLRSASKCSRRTCLKSTSIMVCL